MPPQQSHGLLDLFDERFGFGAHGVSLSNEMTSGERRWNRGRNLEKEAG
jgi:hypothetical protein